MINTEKVPANPEFIKNFYQEAFKELGEKKVPEIEVRFYPYIGLHHTIRMRDGKALVRLAELMADAHLTVQRALAFILVAKVVGRKAPKEADQLYRDYTNQIHIMDKAEESRKTRGRKVIGSAQGKFHDLDRIFVEVNEHYFQNELLKPILSWSQKRARRTLGMYDPTHGTIVISKRLDSAKVPEFIIEYLLYHELLHIKHPIKMVNGRLSKHPREFKQDEKKFARYKEAEKWLKENI